jgi:hypothetical protein
MILIVNTEQKIAGPKTFLACCQNAYDMHKQQYKYNVDTGALANPVDSYRRQLYGKIAEWYVYRHFKSLGHEVTKPKMIVDEYNSHASLKVKFAPDINVNGKDCHIKCTDKILYNVSWTFNILDPVAQDLPANDSSIGVFVKCLNSFDDLSDFTWNEIIASCDWPRLEASLRKTTFFNIAYIAKMRNIKAKDYERMTITERSTCDKQTRKALSADTIERIYRLRKSIKKRTI